ESIVLLRTQNGGIIPYSLTGGRIQVAGGYEPAALVLAQIRSVNERFGDEVAGHEVDDTDIIGANHTFGSRDDALSSQGDDVRIARIRGLSQSREVVGGREFAGQYAVSA